MSVLDISLNIIFVLLGINLPSFFKDFDKRDKRILRNLYLYHLLVSIGFHFFISLNGGDAIHYWNFPISASWIDILDVIKRGSASGYIYLINYIPSKILELSFFTGNMMYSIVGFIGFIYLYKISKTILGGWKLISKYKILGIPIFPWIWFLPNLHFWSSGIGKDVILFFSIAAFVYFLQKPKTFIWGLILSLTLSLAIRPHITLFLLASFGIGFIMDTRMKTYKKIFIGVVILAGFVMIFDYVLEFIKLESIELEVVERYASDKAASLNQEDASSGIDISGYSIPYKIFTFLYRPLFYDVNGILAVFASIENFLLILFTIVVFKKNVVGLVIKGNYLIKGILFYFLIGAISFSLILGNLGIMLRQKNMLFPVFIILGLYTIHMNISKTLGYYNESTSSN